MARAPRIVITVLAATLAAIVISGCAARGVRIAQLKDEPGRYHDRVVSVSGTVTKSWGIPLVPFQFYSVDDGTGVITVLSNRGRPPAQGTHVHVQGRLNEVASFGNQSLGLHIDETNRKIRY